MAKKENSNGKKGGFFHILARADETYAKMPMNMRLDIDKISQGLSEFGPRKMHRRGMGTEFFESRDYRPEVDEARKINARLSARAGRPIVIEKEAEIRQHFYLWRDPSESMNFSSNKKLHTKKEVAEIMLLAFSKHLAKNEELIGVLDRKGVYRGSKAPEALAGHLVDVTVMTGDMPPLNRRLPRHSTVVLFSDFLMDPDQLVKGLEQLSGAELRGFLIMTLDPQELDFNFKGHVELEGLEGEGRHKLKKAESLRAEYQKKMKEHIEWVRKVCAAKGFKLIIQRTDRPLYEGLMAIYGLSPKAPEHTPIPEI